MIWLVTGGCEGETWPVRAFATGAEAGAFASALEAEAHRAAQHVEDNIRRDWAPDRIGGRLVPRPVCQACVAGGRICTLGLPPAQDPEGRRRVGWRGSMTPLAYDVVAVPVGAP